MSRLSLDEPKRHCFKRAISKFSAWFFACSNLSCAAQALDELACVLRGFILAQGVELKIIAVFEHEGNCASRTRARKSGLSPVDKG